MEAWGNPLDESSDRKLAAIDLKTLPGDVLCKHKAAYHSFLQGKGCVCMHVCVFVYRVGKMKSEESLQST